MVYKVLMVLIILISNVNASIGDKNIKTFRANFSQTVTNESGKSIEYQGEVYIKNNGKILWKYVKPILKNVYLIDDILIVDEPELEQAIYSRLEKSIDVLKLIKDAKEIEENLYESTLYNRKYTIKTKNGKISLLSYKDELENKVSISFDDIEQNIELDDRFFQFIAPIDYDIIEK